jgi:hypothetical protein
VDCEIEFEISVFRRSKLLPAFKSHSTFDDQNLKTKQTKENHNNKEKNELPLPLYGETFISVCSFLHENGQRSAFI